MKTTHQEALANAVCYTHFVSLLIGGRSFYKIQKILGNEVLFPFKWIWQQHKKSLINQ